MATVKLIEMNKLHLIKSTYCCYLRIASYSHIIMNYCLKQLAIYAYSRTEDCKEHK